MPQADRRTDDELDAHIADANRVLYEPGMQGKAVAASTVRGLLDGLAAQRAEVAALRAENEALSDRVAWVEGAWAEVIQREQRGDNAHFYDMKELRAELAAELARHETTPCMPREVADFVYDVSYAVPGYLDRDAIVRRAVRLRGRFMKDGRAALAAAASPSPVAGPDVLSEF